MGAELLPAPNTALFIPRSSEELISSNDIYEMLKESLGDVFQWQKSSVSQYEQ